MRRYTLIAFVLFAFGSFGQTAPSQPKAQVATAYLSMSGITPAMQEIFSDTRRLDAFQKQLHDSLKPQIDKILHCDAKQVETLLANFSNNAMELTITMPATVNEQAATEFAKAAVDEVDKHFQQAELQFEAVLASDEWEKCKLEENSARARKADIESDIRALREELSKLGTIDVQVDEVASMAKKLDEERQQATIDVAARSARLDALQKTLAKLISNGEQKAKDDAICLELQKLIDLQEKKVELESKRHDAGLTPEPPLADQTDLSNTKIRLLERREALSHPLSGDKLSELEAQVITLQADVAESQGRMQVIEGMAQRSAEAQQLAEKLRDAEQKDKTATDELIIASAKVHAAESARDQIKPRSIINLNGIQVGPPATPRASPNATPLEPAPPPPPGRGGFVPPGFAR